MAAVTNWSEIAYITLTDQATTPTDLNFCALSESIEIDEGERPLETNYTLCGGKIIRSMPQDDTTITVKAYPIEAGNDGAAGAEAVGKGFWDMFYDSITTASGSVKVDNTTTTRKKYRCAVLWTSDTSSVNATRQIASPTYACLRWVGRNGYITKLAPSFEANGQLTVDMTMKIPSKQADGTANIQIDSLNGVDTATMVTLTSYVSDTTGF
jgi:hypothetical protein